MFYTKRMQQIMKFMSQIKNMLVVLVTGKDAIKQLNKAVRKSVGERNVFIPSI
jgi:hypothetical protein